MHCLFREDWLCGFLDIAFVISIVSLVYSVKMAMAGEIISLFVMFGQGLNEALSFVIFTILDLVDVLLCFVYKVADFFIEAEWKSCYCSYAKEGINSNRKILFSERGESRIVSLSSTKVQLQEISDTLYTRPSVVSKLSEFSITDFKRFKVDCKVIEASKKVRKSTVHSTTTTTTTTTSAACPGNSSTVELLQSKFGRQKMLPIPRWSDCDCNFCTSWSTCSKQTLFVKAEGAKNNKAREDVLFIHGFISSSAFWTETLFPNFSSTIKSTYRLFAVDLLGFGKSPKPADSLYTLREHLNMIEHSVLEPHNVKSFHIVAHSLGCILALALAVKHPGSVKSLTLLAPPYFSVPKGVQASQYVIRRLAPRRVWPLIAFGASLGCWYEHVSRTICLVICKNHRLWEFLTRLVTRNRIRTFLLEGFFCHTHHAAWHTLHNIICGTASKIDEYLDSVRDRLECEVTVFHGKNDELIPVECSYNIKKKIPRAKVKVIENKDHITIVVGRQKAFARELEEIWSKASS